MNSLRQHVALVLLAMHRFDQVQTDLFELVQCSLYRIFKQAYDAQILAECDESYSHFKSQPVVRSHEFVINRCFVD